MLFVVVYGGHKTLLGLIHPPMIIIRTIFWLLERFQVFFDQTVFVEHIHYEKRKYDDRCFHVV